jgi:hypothetical protein
MLQIQNLFDRYSCRFPLALLLVGLLSLAYLPGRFSSQATPSHSVKNAGAKAAANQSSRPAASTMQATAGPVVPGASQVAGAEVKQIFGRLPLNFTANRGQSDSEVQFLARGSGYNLFLTSAEAVLTLHKNMNAGRGAATHRSAGDSVTVLRMKLLDADSGVRGEGVEELPGKTNYFAGTDPNKWHAGVPNFARVLYRSIYPGVDLEYYGNQSQLEYDFVIAPGANPRVIKLSFEGTRKIAIDAQGNLILHTAGGKIRQSKPLVYQVLNGVKKEIDGRYVIKGNREVGFATGSYDASAPLVIDPVISSSSYIGGTNNDVAHDIAVDSLGNAYLTGETFSASFPGTTTPVYVFHEAFVTKLNPAGSAILYSTYLGGSGNEIANRIAVDSTGNAYVVGTTDSPNFPVTAGSFQALPQGGVDTFVTKLSSTGSIAYSTYLGGNGTDTGRGIVVDAAGSAYITGQTSSTAFPTTAGAFKTVRAGDGDAFVTKLNAAGSALSYSTLLGGGDTDGSSAIAVDAGGNAYVTGFTRSANFPITAGAFQASLAGDADDAFVTKLNPSGSALVYSTFLGGINDDIGNDVAVDSLGSAYVTGDTRSPNFPVTPGAFQTTYVDRDAFVTKLNLSGSALAYSTYLTGDGDESSRSVAVDASGNAYVTGRTVSTNFPKVHQLPQPNAGFGAGFDAFVVKLYASGARAFYSTYLGGDGTDFGRGLALDTAGNAYVTGSTDSTTFPTVNPFQANNADDGIFSEGFVTKIAPTFYNISGRVTHAGGGAVAGVTINLTGSQFATTATNSSGDYVFTGIEEGGSYVVTASNAGFTFTPANMTITDLSGNLTVNFTQNDILVTVQTNPTGRTFTVDGITYSTTQTFFWIPGSTHLISTTSPQTGGGTEYVWTSWSDGGAIAHNVSPTTSITYTANFTPGVFQPVVLTADQVEIKTWRFQGRTYVYVKLSFPNAGYRVVSWGDAIRTGNDFAANASVEKFTGASVQAVTTTAQIYDLGPLADGNYTFTFKNSGTTVKTQAFTVSSAPPPPNPIDDARQFVKQQYRDFLNREADQAGEDFWTDNITKCNDPARRPAGQTVEQCILRQRETTSGAFFLSPEFQYTGYFVYRMYQGALGRQPKLSEFIPDAQFVGNGIVVNGQLSGAKINQNKAAFAALFVNCTDATKYRCSEFKAIYDGLNNQQYVDKLFATTGVNASASDRAALVNGLNGGTETRATVLQKVVDGITVIAEGNQQFTTTYGQAFYNAEFNRAFVLLEYFGYMKRDPDDAGYAFWLGKLNQFGGNFVNAEMVLAFISSPEYRARFGQP